MVVHCHVVAPEMAAAAPRKRIMKIFSESESEDEASKSASLTNGHSNPKPATTSALQSPDDKKKNVKLREQMVRYLMYVFPQTITFVSIHSRISKI